MLFKTKYLIQCLNEVIRPLVLMLSKMNEYVKKLKNQDRNKDKNKNNKFLSFRIDNDKLLEKQKSIWTKIEDLENINLDTLPVYDKNLWK